MTVLVTGANGFLGQYVVGELIRTGRRVRALVRYPLKTRSWGNNVEEFLADLRSSTELSRAFENIEAVIHLAAAVTGDEDSQFASTVIGTERLLDAMSESNARRILHISSVAVYDWRTLHGVVDESAPLCRDIYSMGGYAVAKYWQERVVERAANANGWNLTVVRPGFIWGSGATEIAGAGRRIGPVRLVFGPNSKLPLTHVSNCSSCIVTMLEAPSAVGETFNLVDGFSVSAWQYASKLRKFEGRPLILVPVPYAVGESVAISTSFALRGIFGPRVRIPSLLLPRRYEAQFKAVTFSNEKIKKILGWKPRLTLDECWAQTFE